MLFNTRSYSDSPQKLNGPEAYDMLHVAYPHLIIFMTKTNLTQLEFKLAHRLIDDLDLARRNEIHAHESMDEAAIVDYVHRNYIEQGRDIDRATIQKLLQTRLKEQLPAFTPRNSNIDQLMKNQHDEIQKTALHLRQKKFYTNAQFADILTGPIKESNRPKSSLLERICVFLFFSRSKTQNEKQETPSFLKPYLRAGLNRFLEQDLVHPTLLVAYTELTLGRQFKDILPDMDELHKMYKGYHARPLPPKRIVDTYTLSVELLNPELQPHIRFNTELPRAILKEWHENTQPVRILDIYFLQCLEYMIIKHQEQSHFLAS